MMNSKMRSDAQITSELKGKNLKILFKNDEKHAPKFKNKSWHDFKEQNTKNRQSRNALLLCTRHIDENLSFENKTVKMGNKQMIREEVV